MEGIRSLVENRCPPFLSTGTCILGGEIPTGFFFFFSQMRFSSFSFPNEVVFAKYPIAQHATPHKLKS